MRASRVIRYASTLAALLSFSACATPSRPAEFSAPARGMYLSSNRAARSVPEEARERPTPHQADEEWPDPVEDSQLFGFLLFDQLEYRINGGTSDSVRWDAQGWYGGDYNRLWFRSEGESATSGASSTEPEFQLLYSRMVAPFWDVQLGVR